MESLLFVVYAVAFAAIIWYIMELRRRSVVSHVVVETPVVTWWPWSISRFNEWPYWSGWYVGGGNGGYYKPPMRHPPSHGGGHHPPTGGHHQQIGGHHDRPWGGPGRTANTGGFHTPSSAPSAPSGHHGPSKS